jgi:hypothetical protein
MGRGLSLSLSHLTLKHTQLHHQIKLPVSNYYYYSHHK